MSTTDTKPHSRTGLKFSFNSQTVQYSPKNAYWLSFFSEMAYTDQVRAKAETAAIGLLNFNWIMVGNAQCFVASNDKMIVISFRGKELGSFEDLTVKLKSKAEEAYGGKVHSGFLEAYNATKDMLLFTLEKHLKNNQSIWITGHAWGGALALLCGMDLRSLGHKVKGVYTYGQPRVGNAVFCDAVSDNLEGRLFRILHRDDMIPNVQAKKLKINSTKLAYAACGNTIYIAPKSELYLNYERSNTALNKAISLANGLSNHPIQSYTEIMLKNYQFNPFDSPDDTFVEEAIIKMDKVEKDAERIIKTASQGIDYVAEKVGGAVRGLFGKVRAWFH